VSGIVVTLSEQPSWPALADLYRECFNEPWPLVSIENLLRPPGCWAQLAEISDRDLIIPAGFALARVVHDEAEVLSLGVSPRFRRRGVAKSLMRTLLSCAREKSAASLYLEVGIDNNAALTLYKKMNFKTVARRKGYYRRADRSQVDALVMKIVL
tara:strand:+ start:177 stop:641 length:465 start_codon:yes stop_codon:yes gene_type:complete